MDIAYKLIIFNYSKYSNCTLDDNTSDTQG